MALVLQMPNCTSAPSGSTGEIGYVHVCVCRCVSVAMIDGDMCCCVQVCSICLSIVPRVLMSVLCCFPCHWLYVGSPAVGPWPL